MFEFQYMPICPISSTQVRRTYLECTLTSEDFEEGRSNRCGIATKSKPIVCIGVCYLRPEWIRGVDLVDIKELRTRTEPKRHRD